MARRLPLERESNKSWQAEACPTNTGLAVGGAGASACEPLPECR